MTSHGCRMTSNVNLRAETCETRSSLRALVILPGGKGGYAAPSASSGEGKLSFIVSWRREGFAVKNILGSKMFFQSQVHFRQKITHFHNILQLQLD